MSLTDPSPTAAPLSDKSSFESSPWSDNPALAARVERIMAEENVSFGQHGIYTPLIVFGAWLWQALHHKSCRAAVMWVALQIDQLPMADNLDTGNYCRARVKLPENVIRRVVIETAREAEQAAAATWRWRDREAYLIDGTTASMPDTPANQAEYPQPKSQKAGVGFPVVRLVMILSLATAMVHDAAFGPYSGKETGETSLFRSMLDGIPSGSVVVGDRFYCSYWLIALLTMRGVDVVTRLHARRKSDFRQGKPIGPNDRRVVWQRPVRPEWMSEEQYEQIPEQLVLRLVRKRVTTPGFRVKNLIVVTNLMDAVEYTADDISTLYHRRWQAELDIRSIKSTMKMEVLTCKTPENVRREIWMHLLAYNLCREQGAASARLGKVEKARDISLAACRDALQLLSNCSLTSLASRLSSAASAQELVTKMLSCERVGHRPNRCEPRKVKRRPKPQKLLNEPRAEARARILSSSAN